ncbi:MAG: PIN domain-containing protein [Candidatus Omnitrophota bacterium]
MRIFLNANVFFAGCMSKEGASAFVLELGRRKRMELVASKLVLREADRNLRRKAPPVALKAFHQYLQQVKIRIALTPNGEMMKPYEGMIDPKDLPVLVAAIASEADFFLTLDRKHFLSAGLVAKIKKPRILGPADFLRNFYLKGKI